MVEKVNFSEWAAPIVVVPKKDHRVRICGDYKVTINPVLELDQYPFPCLVDLFATLAGGKSFTTLDLSHAYQQLILEESSRKFVTVNTHLDCIIIHDFCLGWPLHRPCFRRPWIPCYKVYQVSFVI